VLGDVNGQLQPVFTKLATLHAKNSFSLAIVAGNLFSDDDDTVSDLLAERITIPLPTYFTVGMSPLPDRIVQKLEKDEEVRIKLIFTFEVRVPLLIPTSQDLPQPPLSRETQYYKDLRGYQNSHTWWTT